MKSRRVLFVSLFAVVATLLLSIVLSANRDTATAQGPVPETERSSRNPFPMSQPNLPDSSAPDARSNGASPYSPNLSFSYYFVPGAALHNRDSTTTHDYSSAGCVYTVSGTDRILNTELHIPDGSIIKYLRLYYNDTNATTNVQGYITRYDPGSATNDLVSVTSSGSSGVGTALSTEITHTVDNFGFAYVLIGWPGANSNTVQVCGLRVAYYAPPIFGTFAPLIQKNP